MIFNEKNSLCAKDQKIIVSKDKGSSVSHTAKNEKQKNVGHYKLDGEFQKEQTACDFLLLNNSDKIAYFIELKGTDLKKAIKQVRASGDFCRSDLKDYSYKYRIIVKNIRSGELLSTEVKKFKKENPKNTVIQSEKYEETI